MIDFRPIRAHKPTRFDFIRIGIASPEEIRGWSYGEVTKPETINYRSFKPERDGLFCERIFGPVKDWECHCGKYKRIRYRGVVCDRCGVEVTLSKVRRERMGHIELAVPVAHIWFFKSPPSRMGYLLDMSIRDLERVIYYVNYVVVEPGETDFEKKQLVSEEEYLEAVENGAEGFKARMGAEALHDLLAELDLAELSADLKAKIEVETSAHRKKNLNKRLRVVEAFRQSANTPTSMIMAVIPVIPPDLRPLVPLEGGRFATSDLNDLYRRVLNRDNRLKKLIDMRAPEVILRNEKRMLQEAVDALFDNGRRSRPVRSRGNRPLKSLSDMLKGKQGRFRQNLLGKRVDYSGRSVIVVGPELQLHQCGLPKVMALELFKPFILRKLEEKGYAQTIKSAKKLVERQSPEVWEILEEVITDHPVLLNRAPTLHRLGVEAFEPVLVEGKAIRIHPLVCTAFNADFDGDQMAVHVPLSFEAQLEARVLMLASNNILLPSNGRPVASPTQDMVLGCYFLTKEGRLRPGEGIEVREEPKSSKKRGKKKAEPEIRPRAFADVEEALLAYEHGVVRLHTPILVGVSGERLQTTVGRLLFNQIVPEELGYVNRLMDKKTLSNLISESYRKVGLRRSVEFLDELKNLGFHYATKAGASVSVEDMVIPQEKAQLVEKARTEVAAIQEQYRKGLITDGERHNKVIDTWTELTSEVAEVMFEALGDDQDGFNPIYMMAASGARGSKDQIRQLAGMRGLMAKPQKKITGQIGEIIESPITSNFREGLSVLEYFISTHGARKGLADTALKTADAGYLTRRLVDVTQDVSIILEDCGTVRGLEVSPLKEGEEVIEPLRERIVGAVALLNIVDPLDETVIVKAGEVIDAEAADRVEASGIEKVRIRSVVTCEAPRGLCRKCYGWDISALQMVDIGEAVGIVAAQSIGEPGTQLTLRTFHIGGTAARIATETEKRTSFPAKAEFERIKTVAVDGREVVISREGQGQMLLRDKEGRLRGRIQVPPGAVLAVKDGEEIEESALLFRWDPYSTPILTDKAGVVKFQDIVEEVTMREELDESTGLRQRVMIEDREKSLHPQIKVVSRKSGKKLRDYAIPVGAHLVVHEGEKVTAGQTLVKIPREIYKTRDITGGLPRVAELFEARHPKDPAVISEIDGRVSFGKIVRGNRQIVVTPEKGELREYLIPHGKHLHVHEGDHVQAGDRLCEGPIDPHDILRIKGPSAVQEFLLNEIQEVYRLQGVQIHDKHIGVVVRQMLRKVRIEDPGETEFLEGDQVDWAKFREENQKVMQMGSQPATSKPVLLGITKASLETDSFISAASFQETTRVLTRAAIESQQDNLLGLKENIILGNLIPAGTGTLRTNVFRFPQLEIVKAEAEEAARRAEEAGEGEGGSARTEVEELAAKLLDKVGKGS